MKFRVFILLPCFIFILSSFAAGSGIALADMRDVDTVALAGSDGSGLDGNAGNTGAHKKRSGGKSGLLSGTAGDGEMPPIKTEKPLTGKTVKEGQTDGESEPGAKTLSIAAVGDIMLGRGVGMRLERENKGYGYPFEKVAGILKRHDLVFGNLEQPMTDRTESLDKRYKYVLKSGVSAFTAIEQAGFNLLSLANNHILDYYDQGLFDTIQILKEKGIAFSGAGKNLDEARMPAIIEKKGLKIALLSYTDMSEFVYRGNPSIRFAADEKKAGVAPSKQEYIREDVEAWRDHADILIVSLHWGVEESFRVQPQQVEFAHSLIDMGVDVILGHHPHQFQGIEIYKGKPVVYSLGNFIFDQNDPENQESFIITLKFTGTELAELTAMPVRTIGKTQVVPQPAAQAYTMLERQIELSAGLGMQCRMEGDVLVYEVSRH